MKRIFAAGIAFLVLTSSANGAEAPPLALEKRIPLGKVNGRMDHFAIDRKGQRLFLAELGNNTVSVMDLKSGTVAHRITGLNEPQGLAYAPDTGILYVAGRGDGAVRAYRTDTFVSVAEVDLGDNVDNLRWDNAHSTLFAGYASGALAALDGKTLAKKADFPLKDHPESFQLEPTGDRVFINVADRQEIAVLDRKTGKQIAIWQAPHRANFPMAVRSDGKQILVVFRSPARLVSFSTQNGEVLADVPTCADSDDVFVDEKRSRTYVACGDGSIDVVSIADGKLMPQTRLQTSRGARTAFFDAELDRFYLAVREVDATPAAVWVFKPN